MEKRHENALMSLLERTAFEGYAAVAKWKLPRWYGQKNLTVMIRRDLRMRWEQLLTEELDQEFTTLHIAECGGDLVLIKENAFYPESE